MGLCVDRNRTYKKPWLECLCCLMQNAAVMHRMAPCWSSVSLQPEADARMTLWQLMKCRWKTYKSGRDHSPARCRWGGTAPRERKKKRRRRRVGYTLLRNSPPVGCSGVLHSEEFLALSLLLLGSLSLIMSYWRQKRAITPGRRDSRVFCEVRMEMTHTKPVWLKIAVLTCPHDEHHHDDDELPCPQLGGLANFLHCDFVWWSKRSWTTLKNDSAFTI